jgi:hypothetical protein
METRSSGTLVVQSPSGSWLSRPAPPDQRQRQHQHVGIQLSQLSTVHCPLSNLQMVPGMPYKGHVRSFSCRSRNKRARRECQWGHV